MENESKDDKIMFYIGISLIVIAMILFFGNFMRENIFPIILMTIGIAFISSSKFRLFK